MTRVSALPNALRPRPADPPGLTIAATNSLIQINPPNRTAAAHPSVSPTRKATGSCTEERISEQSF